MRQGKGSRQGEGFSPQERPFLSHNDRTATMAGKARVGWVACSDYEGHPEVFDGRIGRIGPTMADDKGARGESRDIGWRIIPGRAFNLWATLAPLKMGLKARDKSYE